MDEEKLIELVKACPALYDLEHESYLNTNKKHNIWKDISGKMGVSAFAAKEKWKVLRDSFHRSIKRRRAGLGGKTAKKWRHESRMQFLLPYFQRRQRKILDESDHEEHVESDSNTSPIAVLVDSPRPQSRTSSTSDPLNSQSFSTSDLPKEAEAKPTHEAVSRRNAGPIYSFFKAMADTTVGLSPDLQLKVKNAIYSTVSQAELENMKRPAPAQSVSTSNLPEEEVEVDFGLYFTNFKRESS